MQLIELIDVQLIDVCKAPSSGFSSKLVSCHSCSKSHALLHEMKVIQYLARSWCHVTVAQKVMPYYMK